MNPVKASSGFSCPSLRYTIADELDRRHVCSAKPERECHRKTRKSVVAEVAIPKGSMLSMNMFAVKVGETKGIPPDNMERLVGRPKWTWRRMTAF
ncbi:hypothetical protein PAMA_016218 [Pampus argenteus]